MGKKHFSDDKADRRGGRDAGGPGGYGRGNERGGERGGNDRGGERGGYSSARPGNGRPPTNGAFGRPATNGAFGRPSNGGFGGKKFEGGEKRSFGGPRPEGRSGGFGGGKSFGSREQGAGGRPFERPYERRDDRPRVGKEQRSGTGYGRFDRSQDDRAPRNNAPREDARPVSDYKPRENWSGQPYRRDGEKAVPRGNPGERNRKFVKQNPNEESAPARSFSPGFGRSEPRESREEGGFQRSEETGPNRPIRSARPFEANPPQPREERGAGGYERDDEGDRAAFGRKFTPGAFGKQEKFNPRHQGGDRPRSGSSRPEAPTRSSFSAQRDALKAQERSVRRSGTGYGSDAGQRATGRLTQQNNRADKPRYGEVPGEAPDYKNLKHYEADKNRGNKRRREEDDDFGTDELRLNRYIANAGICSRREADALIAAGEIKVNGEVVTEMGYKVQPSDTVQYGKTNLNREKLVYVLLNKPKDFITTTEDPEGRRTVMDLVASSSKERIFPVGRLDRNTTGLLLFTNDGEVAQKLSHPSHKNKKIYQVELSQPLTEDHLRQISEGLELEDGKAEVDDVAVVAGNAHFVGIEIHIGRNRIVRRIFEHLGYEVVALDRVQYAGITKKDLPRGKWRFLTEQEVIRLKYFM
ncbi:pseudouridine synthase [Hymenobacter sp. ASUV-10]|uniref:Pseudouridine synthase n=1 Tax=Hymenobacter aranciens TaxID=3063996 RepID=A0ABT9B4S6_9BACT|nr:pseudouridine synthase [Hymenobacter sp. ASUV-10]MDO7873153.1 pseudouridine synthase [Hymenobacter sp. ASUV-10]